MVFYLLITESAMVTCNDYILEAHKKKLGEGGIFQNCMWTI